MNKFKKIFITACVVLLALITLCASGCRKAESYGAKAIASESNESYGFAIGKNSTEKKKILTAMNEVIAEVEIDEVVEYYSAVQDGRVPDATLPFPNLTDNTGEALQVYTNAEFPPFEFRDGEQAVVGVDIYYMQLVAEKLNMQLSVNDIAFDAIVGKISSENNAVAASGLTINEERKTAVDFSAPYFSTVQCIVSESGLSYSELSQLRGKRIGVQKGTTGWDIVDEAIRSGELKDSGAEVVQYDNAALAYTALQAEKCDVLVIDELPAQKLVSGATASGALQEGRWAWYLEGLGRTMLISLGAIAIGCALGIIVALIKYTNKKYGKLKIAGKTCDLYVAVFRGTPVYVQLLIMYLIVLVAVPDIWVAILTFGINSGAYVAEIIRGGLESVDDGQLEAGNSLGLSKIQVLFTIVLPQAIRRALPPFCNEFIALIKETSIVGTIGIVDLTKVAASITSKTYSAFVPYIITALLYLAVVLLLTYLLKLLERRLARSDK